jgi:acyl carrier protein
MTTRSTILDQITLVARLQNQTLAPLTDDLLLLESGLDSLSLAIIVANLEDELGLDPFGAGGDVAIPKTVGDLIRLYENANG